MMTVPGSRKAFRVLVPIATLMFVLWHISLPEYHEEKSDNHWDAFVQSVKTLVPTRNPLLAPTPGGVVEQVTTQTPTPTPTPLGKHKYRSDGLLEVNFDGPHPIYELIAAGEERWEKKLARASKTLEDAVVEYKRRYKRAPPKGFDLWWHYVTEHNVRLPDEYDQIHHDLEPFWGIAPEDLLKTQEELEKKKDSYTLGKNEKGEIVVLTWAFNGERYKEMLQGSKSIIALLQEVREWLPPFRATFSPHDGPNRVSDYEIKSRVLEAAASQSYLERSALPKVSGYGWRFACSPDSPARQNPVDINKPPVIRDEKTFIHDHVTSMDPCLHTNYFLINGQLIGQRDGPLPQATMVPEFSHCSSPLHHNIRMPTPYAHVEEVLPRSDDPPFEKKIEDRLLWRGRNTGIHHGPDTLWRNSHRDYFVRVTNEIEGTLDILNTNVSKTEPVGSPRKLRKSRLNPAMMDVAFADVPIMCSGGVCELLDELYQFKPFQGGKESGKYKYVFDIDGNGWSGRFKKLMTTNSLIFKSTMYPEWYHDRIEPWVHYIPIQIDLSDLHDALGFFRGDGNGDGAHEELGAKIAAASREWSKTFWRREDLIAYFFRLMLEFSRLMSLDREAMSFTEEGD